MFLIKPIGRHGWKYKAIVETHDTVVHCGTKIEYIPDERALKTITLWKHKADVQEMNPMQSLRPKPHGLQLGKGLQ
jgi:hypothetical protein